MIDNPDLGGRLLALASGRATESFAAGHIPAETATAVLGPRRLGELLTHPLLRHPQVRIAVEGRPVSRAEYVSSRRIGTQYVDDGIDARQIVRWLARGATVALDSLEYLVEPVDEVCDRLSDELGIRATATAYITPPGRQGLSPHTDEEDVFVLQTFGSKRWIIDSDQRQEIATASSFPMNQEMSRVEPRVLRAGDMFFMPAGTPHVATAEDDMSIHVTFSVDRPRVRQALDDAVDCLVASSPQLQKLQAWCPDPLDLALLLDSLEISPIAATESLSAPMHLPFGSWENLFRGIGTVRWNIEPRISESTEGYSFAFPEFTIRANRTVGSRLLGLRSDRPTPLGADEDSELVEVLFHLAARGAITIGSESGR